MGILAATWAHSLADAIPLLTILVLLPLFAAVLVALLPQRQASRLAQIISGVVALFALLLPVAFRSAEATGYQFVDTYTWFPDFGAAFALGVDGISLWLVVLTALVFPVVLCLVHPESPRKGFFAWMLVAEGSLLGAFLATDLLVFFVFFEFVLVPSFFLILGWGNVGRRYAALKFFLYTFFGSVFLLVGILAAAVYSAQIREGALSFDYTVLSATNWTDAPRVWFMVAFAVAFAVKTPLLPVHTWVKSFYQSAPLALVIVSSAVMVKLGAYGFVRFCLQMFGGVGDTFAMVMCTLGVLSVVVGALLAIGQRDIRLVIAYSSISHLGMIVFGAFAGQQLALGGAVLQMVAHGVIATGILFLASTLQARTGTLEIDQLSGWQSRAPWLGGAFLIFVLALIGVPALAGFVGEFLILVGTFVTYRWWTAVALLGLVFAVIYGLWMYQRVFHRNATERTEEVLTRDDLSWREKLVVAPLVLLVVGIGVYPGPLLNRIEPTVEQIARTKNFVWTKSLDVRGFQQFPVTNAEGWAEYVPGGNS